MFSSVQSLSHIQFLATLQTAAHQASLSITYSQSLLKLMSVESVMPSNHLILCHPLLLLLHSFPASGSLPMSQFYASSGQRIGVSASASVLPIFQHNSSKASILQRSIFFMVQLSHPYMTTGKTIALTRWTIVSKVMSLLFNMLPRLVIAFLPRSKCLLIS